MHKILHLIFLTEDHVIIFKNFLNVIMFHLVVLKVILKNNNFHRLHNILH